MRYRFTLQERDGSWVYVLCFGKDTPTEIKDVVAYSDNCVSAEDAHRVRHYVYTRADKIVSIHLHDALRLLPHLDPEQSRNHWDAGHAGDHVRKPAGAHAPPAVPE
jgi:hypothetical protein